MPNYKSGIAESLEESSTPVSVDSESTTTDGLLIIGNQITLPTTKKFYRITALGMLNGTAVSGNVQLIAVVVDGDPPVSTEMLVIAYTPITSQSGTSAEQKINTATSLIVGGGAKITGGMLIDNATGKYQYDTISSANANKAAFGLKATPDPYTQIAWGANTAQPYVKIYYKGHG